MLTFRRLNPSDSAPNDQPIAHDPAARDEFESELSRFTDAEIETQHEAAHSELVRLRIEADDLDTQASEAAQAFEVSPNEKTLAKQAISKQRAINARKVAQAFEASLQPLHAEWSQRKQRRRHAELLATMDVAADIEASTDRIEQITRDFTGAIQAEFESLSRVLAARNQCVGEVANLDKRFGEGRYFSRTLISDVAKKIAKALEARGVKYANLTCFRADGRKDIVVAEMKIGASFPHEVL